MLKSYLILSGILLIAIFVFLKIFYYFEPVPWCRLKIDSDLIKGNKKTIIQAIKQIKAQDPQSYKDLCKYVDVISEKYCRNSASFKREYFDSQIAGCYVKGSHHVYLTPEKDENQQIINKRVQIIEKYTQKSKEFWLSHQ